MENLTYDPDMDGILIYNDDYLDIPLQDMPPVNGIMVCLDPQKRLGRETWAVLRAVSEEGIVPAAKALGLFWSKQDAVLFAGSLK